MKKQTIAWKLAENKLMQEQHETMTEPANNFITNPRLFNIFSARIIRLSLCYGFFMPKIKQVKTAPNWTIIMLWKQRKMLQFVSWFFIFPLPPPSSKQLRHLLSAMLNLIYWHENYASMDYEMLNLLKILPSRWHLRENFSVALGASSRRSYQTIIFALIFKA